MRKNKRYKSKKRKYTNKKRSVPCIHFKSQRLQKIAEERVRVENGFGPAKEKSRNEEKKKKRL